MADTAARPLEGRSAIVTGASRGIGKAIAARLASAGAHVVLGARSVDVPQSGFTGTVHETAEEIRALGGKATPLALDLNDAASREKFIADATQATGGIDILVNNAGTALYKKTWEMTIAEAEGQIAAYFTGPWHLCHLVLPQMIERKRGWILNLGSSVATKWPEPGKFEEHMKYFGDYVLYGAVKTAMHRFSAGLAAEVFTHNIAVNVLGPVGGVYTPGLDSLGLGMDPNSPVFEIPEQMAEAALALVSKEPTEQTGVIAWSHKYLDEIGRSTMSLDGKTVLVDRSATVNA
ncbi:SDR family NAD(P)-dependent oxidoreductase [Sphingobium tyrosinilyticum]|uniref:SDR family NAD(P)-dependent oxidoreductase n=1 Tax=Sphingobium tyrosinilyticum TaxID=2715436 RepID=A0ABV9F3H5_9SPHN